MKVKWLITLAASISFAAFLVESQGSIIGCGNTICAAQMAASASAARAAASASAAAASSSGSAASTGSAAASSSSSGSVAVSSGIPHYDSTSVPQW